MPTIGFDSHRLIQGDCLDAIDEVKNGSCKLVITSPPYNIGKSYERGQNLSLEQYLAWLKPIVGKLCKKVTKDGSICWQVGNHVADGEVFPLDLLTYELFKKKGFRLRNRIVWHFNFGLHSTRRLSGRYETLLWFTKSDNYTFNLDDIRVPQLYPGKRHSQARGDKAGSPSGNPLGKNPTDYWTFNADTAFFGEPIWDLPNVKANHPEWTEHPCQFPSELVERCILAMTNPGDTVLDPFLGSGTTVIAAAMHQRKGIGIDLSSEYLRLSNQRLQSLYNGTLKLRQSGLPVRRPIPGEKVASIPDEWKAAAE